MKILYILFTIIMMPMLGCSSISDTNKDEPPRAISLAPAEYPLVLKKAGITGNAVIEFVVTKTGEPADARVISATHPLFGASAIEAILKSKFTVPLKDGRPVNARMRVPLYFNLTPDK